MTNYRIYVGGEFVSTDTVLEVINPFSGEVFANTFLAGDKEFEMATKAAENVQETLKNLPLYKRFEILREISDQIKANRTHLATVLSEESAKPMRYALGEIDRAAQTFLIAAEESKRIPGEEMIRLDWTPKGKGKTGAVRQFPIGLVAGIAPFNFPMNLAVHKIAPAIASGCPIVLKPASATPLSTLELAKIIDQTELPKGAVSILPMDRITGNKLVTDPRYKLLSFTGSPVVGWQMKGDAGEKRVVLELGGNAGVILTESTDLEKALPKCLTGAFAYSGQVCIHAQRFFIHETIFEGFLMRLKEVTENLVTGDPVHDKTQFSSMIDEGNARRVEEWVNEAVSSGAKIITGGKRNGSIMPPTILTNVPPDAKVNSEEVFGPVVCLFKFKTLNEAIHNINDTKFGLQAGIFSNDFKEIQLAFDSINCGGVIVNDVPTFRVDHMPYGGIKQSGLGREGVKYAMADMLEPKILVYDH